MSGQIFISYRRQESGWSARSLHSRLCRDFDPSQIFMDLDAIALGEDFIEAIETTVAKCDVLIALIGNNWLTSKDERGNRRLDSPEDFVRMEIGTALKRKIRVIPVLVDGALMPRPDDLPEDLKLLVRRNALAVTTTSFEGDCQRLAAAIRQVLEKAAAEERERLAAEKHRREEKERLEAEARQKEEKERLEAEQREKERLAAEQREKERLQAEQREKERLEAVQREKERLAAEQREQERLEAVQREKERLEAERLEKERLEAERLKKERLEAEQGEKEQLEAERLEKERLEAERLKKEERETKEQWEKQRLAAEQREKDRAEAEQRKRDQILAEQREKERLEAKRLEKERLEAEQRERKKRLKEAQTPFSPIETIPAPEVKGAQTPSEHSPTQSWLRKITIDKLSSLPFALLVIFALLAVEYNTEPFSGYWLVAILWVVLPTFVMISSFFNYPKRRILEIISSLVFIPIPAYFYYTLASGDIRNFLPSLLHQGDFITLLPYTLIVAVLGATIKLWLLIRGRRRNCRPCK